jgi:predicted  nucleic acid-binding Zn-ribbon protein
MLRGLILVGILSLCFLSSACSYRNPPLAVAQQDLQREESTREMLSSFNDRLCILEKRLNELSREPTQGEMWKLRQEVFLLQKQMEQLRNEIEPHLELISAY